MVELHLVFLTAKMSQSMSFTLAVVTASDSHMLSRNSTKYSVEKVSYEM